MSTCKEEHACSHGSASTWLCSLWKEDVGSSGTSDNGQHQHWCGFSRTDSTDREEMLAGWSNVARHVEQSHTYWMQLCSISIDSIDKSIWYSDMGLLNVHCKAQKSSGSFMGCVCSGNKTGPLCVMYSHYAFWPPDGTKSIALGFQDPRGAEIRSSQVSQLKRWSATALIIDWYLDMYWTFRPGNYLCRFLGKTKQGV